jgi:hypothetical protein
MPNPWNAVQNWVHQALRGKCRRGLRACGWYEAIPGKYRSEKVDQRACRLHFLKFHDGFVALSHYFDQKNRNLADIFFKDTWMSLLYG